MLFVPYGNFSQCCVVKRLVIWKDVLEAGNLVTSCAIYSVTYINTGPTQQKLFFLFLFVLVSVSIADLKESNSNSGNDVVWFHGV